MILFAFVLFAVLIAGWLVAPSGKEEVEVKTAPAPAIQLGEAIA